MPRFCCEFRPRLKADARKLTAGFRCSILSVPRGAGTEWQSGTTVPSFGFPVSRERRSSAVTRNTKLETDFTGCRLNRRLFGYHHHEGTARSRCSLRASDEALESQDEGV